MKRARLVLLSILLCFGCVVFSACKEEEPVVAESISVSTESVALTLGDITTIDVSILPANTTNKDFEVVALDENVVKISYDKKNMQFSISAPNEFTNGNSTWLEIRTKDGSELNTKISVYVSERPATVETPKNLHFDGTNLVWSEVNGATGYVVNINGVDMPVVYTNSYYVDTESERLTAKVKALGEVDSLSSAYSPEYTFQILSAPKNLEYTKQGILQWDAVEGATSYIVYVDGALSSTYDSSLNLSDRFSEAKVYEIKVMAVGDESNNFVDSEYSEVLTIEKLSAPQNIHIENGILIWDAVSGSIEYKVFVDDLDAWRVTGTTYTIQSDLSAGDHIVKLQAIGNETSYLSSAISITINFKKLDTIKSIRIEDGIIRWSENLEATNYMLYVNGHASQTSVLTTTSYDFVDYASGTYRLNIQAIGNGGNVLNSDLRQEDFTATKLAAPESLQISRDSSGNILQWNEVEHASKYYVYIDDENISGNGTDQTSFLLPSDLASGTHKIVVKAVGDSTRYINSNYSQKFTSTKLAQITDLKVQNGVVTWSKISGVSAYQVLIRRDASEETILTTDVSFKFSSTDEKTYDAGIYSIQVKPLSKDVFNMDGEYSSVLTVEKLESPSLKVAGGKISDVSVANADHIEYTITNSKGTSVVTNLSTISTDRYEEISIVAKAVAKNGTNYINSDVSSVLWVAQLPKITDMKISNGILSFGQTDYSQNAGGYSFEIEVINKTDDTTYNVVFLENTSISLNGLATDDDNGILPAGTYGIKITVVSEREGTSETVDGSITMPYLTSNTSSEKQFTVLASPTDVKIKSMADDCSTVTELLYAVSSMGSVWPGSLVWESVDGALSYSIEIDGVELSSRTVTTTSSNLDGMMASGDHTIRVRALGDGENYISSEYSEEVTFTKLDAPTNLRVENGILAWDSSYNQNLSLFSLISKSVNIVIYVAVINGQNYVTLEDKEISDTSSVISALKDNTFTLPKLSSGQYSINMYAVPLNSYMSMSQDVYRTETTYSMSNISTSTIYMKSLDTPLGLNMQRDENGNQVLSWSKLLYENNEVKNYRLVIKKDDGKTQETIDIPFDTNKWTFSAETCADFENITYGAGTYTFSIYAVANDNAVYVDKTGVEYYYVNSASSTAVSVRVLETPTLYVENGVINWSKNDYTQDYVLYIDDSPVSVKNTKYVLGEDYSAGSHTFKIMAVGDGVEFISSDVSTESEYIKLEKITGVKVSSGVVVYNENSIVANQSNSCVYTLSVNGKSYSNAKLLASELDGLNSGRYTIYVYATGDDSVYLTSDKSEECEGNPFKLATPSKSGIKVSNGMLTWDSIDNTSTYLLYISGKEEEYSIETVGVSYSFAEIEAGSYTVKIKALGNSLSYINSNWSSAVTISKLSEIKNLRVEDGKITWDRVETNSANSIKLAIAKAGESKYTEITLTSTDTSYSLGSTYEAGVYKVYMYNAGGSNAISSAKTSELNVTKLSAPINLKITTDADALVQYITFDAVENASGYVLKINNEEKELDEAKIATSELDIENSGTYNISVMAKGTSTSYLDSNYSTTLTITKPNKPEPAPVYTDSTNQNFTGKIVWSADEYADYYRVTITKETTSGDETTIVNTTETYIYVGENANYRVYVTACQNADGFDSEPSDTLVLSYALFTGSGTEDDPYRISTSDNFNNIKFNKSAYYQLVSNVDFTGKTIETISTEDEPFEGVIDGNGYSIVGLSINNNGTYMGVIPVLGENGTIKNLSIEASVSDGEIVGGIVGINYGTVENCTSTGKISPVVNSANTVIKVGGIVAINYGNVVKCLNNAEVKPQNSLNVTYAGGIVAENYGTVSGSGNNGSVYGTYAGGVAAISSSTIAYCYNNASAYIEATAFRVSSQSSAYAGGIVGLTDETNTISYSYNVGKVVAISDYTSIRPYAGGLVGYNNGSTISGCYSTMGSNSTSTNIYVVTPSNGYGYAGILVGYNQSGEISSANVSVYSATTQSGAYNVSAPRYQSYLWSNIDEYTIINNLGNSYEATDTIYPILKNAKY